MAARTDPASLLFSATFYFLLLFVCALYAWLLLRLFSTPEKTQDSCHQWLSPQLQDPSQHCETGGLSVDCYWAWDSAQAK